MTKTFGLFGALAVLAAATALSGCGGGGGGGGFGPGGQGVSVKQPSLTAGGVRASMANTGGGVGNTTILIRTVGGISWSHNPANELTAPSADWVADTKLNAPSSLARERFHAVTDYNTDGDSDYLAYGFWSRNVPDTLTPAGFRSFFYGNMPYAAGIGDVNGPLNAVVTYTGGAAGVYRIAGTSSYGYFKGNFQLKAGFGEGGKVEARITGISRQSGSPAFDFGDSSRLFAGYSGGNRFTGLSHGPNWGGQFFGPSGSGQIPTGVAGWFENVTSESTATNDNRVAGLSGSFGAKCSNNC